MNQDQLTEWQLENDKDAHFCDVCNKSIWYENTRASLRSRGKFKGTPRYSGTSYKTTKTLGKSIYPLLRCSVCLSNEIPSYSNVNKSRIFNTLNEYVSYAFNIPMNVIDKFNKAYVPTLDNFIHKYGKEEGNRKWDEYRLKQSIKNTLEYKKSKLGWNKEDFDKYNKSRAVTLENLTRKYGKVEGKSRWDSYIKKQRETKSKQYVVEKYGINYWINLCKSKAHTLENYILRFGESDGIIKFEEYVQRMANNFAYSSKMANDFLSELVQYDPVLFSGLTTYCSNFGGEYGKFCKSTNSYYFIDFYIKELNIGIEFNGDYFHANPNLYEDTKSDFWHTSLTALEIRKKDQEKINALKKDHDIDIITVWESDYFENPDKTYMDIINKIKKRYELRV